MKTLGRYEIVKEIGRGAMGVVYLGHDPNIGRKVALKCLKVTLAEAKEGLEKRFRQEMQALGRAHHPNIVTIFDADTNQETAQAFIVMEFVEGTSLDRVIKDHPDLSNAQIVQMGIQICQGLDFAHAQGVIHRDIKPANILLSADLKTLKITDFGIARLDDSSLTKTNASLGTPHYMSPEQIRGETVNGRSDIFATGALLYELLTKQKAFRGETLMNILHQVIFTAPPALPLKEHHVPEALIGVVMKALEKEAGQRFASGAEMADALERSLEKEALPDFDHLETSGTEVDSEMTQTVYEAAKIDLEMPADTKEDRKDKEEKHPEGLDQTRISSPGEGFQEDKKPSPLPRYAAMLLVFLVFFFGIIYFFQSRDTKDTANAPQSPSTPSETVRSKDPQNTGAPLKGEAGEKNVKETPTSVGKTVETESVPKKPETEAPETKTAAREPAIPETKKGRKDLLVGHVFFDVTPEGADILINGSLKGLSPLSLDVPAGSIDLLVRKSGYHDLVATIDIPAGEKVPLSLTMVEE